MSTSSRTHGTARGTAPRRRTAPSRRRQRPTSRMPRPTGGPGRGGPFAGMNVPAEKAMNFWPSARRLLGDAAPGAAVAGAGPGARRRQRGVLGDRAAAAGRGHQPDLRRRGVQEPAGRGEQGAGDRAAARRRGGSAGGHARRDDADAGDRDRLRGAGHRAAVGAGAVCAGLGVRLDPGVRAQRRGAADGVPAARADRGEDQPAAAAVLRFRPARRAAQPGDERRGQHLPEPAAVHQPGRHVPAHGGWACW